MAREFEWDHVKLRTNTIKHGVNFYDAVGIFAGDIIEQIDQRKDYGEQRMIAIGAAAGRFLTVVYTWRGEARRIISARRAHPNERKAYREKYPLAD